MIDGQVVISAFNAIAFEVDPTQPAALESRRLTVIPWRMIGGHVALIKLNANGSTDTTFGVGGTAVSDFGFLPNGMTIQPDGEILVVGPTPNGLELGRFKADGSVDTSFGAAGQIVCGISYGNPSLATSEPPLAMSPIGIQADGKIVLAGGTSGQLALVRFDSDGSLDTGFGSSGNGEVVTASQPAIGLVVQSAGIVAISGDFTMTRFTTAGSVDPSFHSGPGLGAAFTATVQSDGEILVAGYVVGSSRFTDGLLVRYNPDGTLDTTFGSNGVDERTASELDTVPGASFPHLISVAQQADGKLVVAYSDNSETPTFGSVQNPPQHQLGLARFGPDGTPDATFGNGGVVIATVDAPAVGEFVDVVDVALQPDGDVVVAGNTSQGFLARFKPDGTPDPGFGFGGIVTPVSTDPTQGVLGASTVSILPGGEILFVGDDGDETVVAQYNPDGSLDTTFGTDGEVSLPLSFGSEVEDIGDKILLIDGVGDLMRLNADGSVDTQFGDEGFVTSPLSDLLSTSNWTDAAQSDGKILLGGNDGDGYFLARWNADGTPDCTFGNSGLITDQFFGEGADSVSSIATQPNGQIVVSGGSYDFDTGTAAIALARYNSDGSPDTTFGAGGTVILSSPSLRAFDGYYDGLLIQPDDRIVQVAYGTSGTAALIRFNPDGSLDSTFGLGGIADGGPNAAGFVGGAVLQIDGNVVVAGAVNDPSQQGGIAVTRFQGGYQVNPSTIGGPAGLLQSIVTTEQEYGAASSVTLQADSSAEWSAVVSAITGLTLDPSKPITVTIDLDGGTYMDTQISAPPGLTVVIRNGTLQGGSPALVLDSGTVVVQSVTLTNATDAPTVVVNGGSLTVRDSSILSEGGYGPPALLVAGGTVDLGTANSPGGNTVNVNGAGALIVNTSGNPVSTGGDTFTINGAVPAPSCLSGLVFSDFNHDGQVDFGEQGIARVTIALDGTDFLGDAVHLSQATDAAGTYVFQNLLPGTYMITEQQQPAGYTPGINSIGTGGGTAFLEQFDLYLAAGLDAMNYNYGEQPAATGAIQKGQTAGIGFWNNKNGQALIKALNGGTGTQLGDWLAVTFPHMFGAPSGSNELAGESNAYVAAFFQSRFVVHDQKLDAQVLATALAVYVTNPTLDNTGVGTQYGFNVSGSGVATATVNVGSNGAAFGVANNTTMTVLDLLVAADSQAVSGVLYNGNTAKRNMANSVFSAINEAGGI